MIRLRASYNIHENGNIEFNTGGYSSRPDFCKANGSKQYSNPSRILETMGFKDTCFCTLFNDIPPARSYSSCSKLREHLEELGDLSKFIVFLE